MSNRPASTMENTSAKSASFKTSPELPTMAAYGALGLVCLGLIYEQRWLTVLGAILLTPLVLLAIFGTLAAKLLMRSISRYPERYTLHVIEDADGNIVSTKWALKRD